MARALVLPVSLALAMLAGCTRSREPDPEASARAPDPTPGIDANQLQAMANWITDVEAQDRLELLALACEGARLRESLAGLSPDELRSIADISPTISLRMLAIWEHDRSFAADGSLTRSSLDRLEAALAVELGQAPPTWWINQLASAKLREGDASGPPYYDVGLSEQGDRRGAVEPGPGGTRARSAGALLLSETEGQLSYDLSMGRVVLGPLPNELGTMIEHARAPAGTTIYYASFSPGSGGFRFPLRAVDSRGSLVWTAEVCGPDRKVLGGLGYLSAEIVVLDSGAGIAVFTAESHGIALEVFDPQTGARKLAWSSDFWFGR